MLDILLILLDCYAISELRRFLLDFLIGQKNRKSALKIHSEQSVMDKLTLSYIPSYLKQYVSQYRFHHCVYLVLIVSLLPQYVIVIILNVLLAYNSRIVLYVFCGIKLLINISIRLQVDSLRQSIYGKRKK